MNLRLWLEDYRLAYQAGGVDNDDFIIRNLPLFLADLARIWLETFKGNFQGTYKHPRNPWNLKNYR